MKEDIIENHLPIDKCTSVYFKQMIFARDLIVVVNVLFFYNSPFFQTLIALPFYLTTSVIFINSIKLFKGGSFKISTCANECGYTSIYLLIFAYGLASGNEGDKISEESKEEFWGLILVFIMFLMVVVNISLGAWDGVLFVLGLFKKKKCEEERKGEIFEKKVKFFFTFLHFFIF